MIEAERTAKCREPEVWKRKTLTVLVEGSRKKDPRKVPRGWISEHCGPFGGGWSLS